MNVNDDLAEDEDPLPLEIPTGCVLVSSTPAAPTATLFKGHILRRNTLQAACMAAVGYRVTQGDYHATG